VSLSAQQYVVVGEVSGVFGVKGWIKVYSFTSPKENILTYSPWLLRKGSDVKTVEVLDGNLQGKAVVAWLSGINDRDTAVSLNGYEIVIDASLLPEPEKGEYYWRDLIGLKVETEQGIALGVVDYLLETGANDVLVVKDGDKERLIPFLQGQFVKHINLETGLMIVDWNDFGNSFIWCYRQSHRKRYCRFVSLESSRLHSRPA
jgi:16S rRNA processing protein RimM